MLKKRKELPGGLIASDLHAALVKGRHAATQAYLKADRNRWFYLCLVLLFVVIFMAMGWYRADKRFAENVQVAWVKMYPNGHTDTVISDPEKPVDFFNATVESKLSEFIEKRYSKRRETITQDYGFAYLMMSPAMQTDFMVNYKAAEVAADFVKCVECTQITAKIREIQLIDKDLIANTKKRQQYTSLVFSTEQSRTKEGKVTGCQNKITTLLWTFRPSEEIVRKREELRYNPLGMDIIRADQKDDSTPINLRECQKL